MTRAFRAGEHLLELVNEVIDQGSGIAADDLSRILESRPGEGSTFRLALSANTPYGR